MQFAIVAVAVGLVLAFVYGSITYVYRDAPPRGMDPGQWAGILALTVGLGLFAYLVVRDDVQDGEDDPATAVDRGRSDAQ